MLGVILIRPFCEHARVQDLFVPGAVKAPEVIEIEPPCEGGVEIETNALHRISGIGVSGLGRIRIDKLGEFIHSIHVRVDDPDIHPGTGGAGLIAPSTLEASTVDLAEEFTKLITTQRAFSASTKIITTADEMLDELNRVKR